MCWIKLAACLSFFQCKSSIVSYRIVSSIVNLMFGATQMFSSIVVVYIVSIFCIIIIIIIIEFV